VFENTQENGGIPSKKLTWARLMQSLALIFSSPAERFVAWRSDSAMAR